MCVGVNEWCPVPDNLLFPPECFSLCVCSLVLAGEGLCHDCWVMDDCSPDISIHDHFVAGESQEN